MTHVSIPIADYERLVLAAQSDDLIVFCEQCGAWIYQTESASIADYTSCWFAVTGEEKYKPKCKSYRSIK